jgi:hypothetical protein
MLNAQYLHNIIITHLQISFYVASLHSRELASATTLSTSPDFAFALKPIQLADPILYDKICAENIDTSGLM